MTLQEAGSAEAIRVALKCLESMAARPTMFSLAPRHTAAALGCTLTLDRCCSRFVAALSGSRHSNGLWDRYFQDSDILLLLGVRSGLLWQLTDPVR